jgi:hypothetical protein
MAGVYLYCDESGKYKKDAVITLSGVAATRPFLESFVNHWEALLLSYGIGPELHMSRVSDLTQGCGHKMPAGQSIEERIDALLPFADCINDYLQLGLAQSWDVKGYVNLPLELKQELGGSLDPHQFAFSRGLLEIVRHLGSDDYVSVVCDDDPVTAWDTYLHYRAVAKAEPKVAKKVAAITFANSEHFKVLQAADMVAFLSRRHAIEIFGGKQNNFGRLYNHLIRGPRSKGSVMRWFDLLADEAKMVEFANLARGTPLPTK